MTFYFLNTPINCFTTEVVYKTHFFQEDERKYLKNKKGLLLRSRHGQSSFLKSRTRKIFFEKTCLPTGKEKPGARKSRRCGRNSKWKYHTTFTVQLIMVRVKFSTKNSSLLEDKNLFCIQVPAESYRSHKAHIK